MRISSLTRLLAIGLTAALAAGASSASAALVVFDDFNVDEGHFTSAPNASGSTNGIDTATSAFERVTTGTFEGAGAQELIITDDTTTAGGTARVRHLSGGASPANNLSFTTTAGTDGWIGLALKTTTPGWTVQIWLEGQENNGSVPKEVAGDGQWHIYQWNLDDETGGADGWGAVAGIVAGDADFENGSYTIDSVIFRQTAMPATSTIYMDYVVRNTDGQIIPEPATAALALISALGALGLVRRRA